MAEFNLLDEPWIIAADLKGGEVTLPLKDVLLRAHDLLGLSGELPTQDAAILRLLLGVLHAVFSRVDEHGEPHPPERMAEDVYEFWGRLWEMKKFPDALIADYLGKYRDRFYLFDDERPFYQMAGLDRGTYYDASKLIGELSESSNKIRLFQGRSGGAKKVLPFGEAARWLVYLNAYDDTSAKKSVKEKLPSTGAGWLGKMGMVYASGANLFETLMLNLTLTDDDGELWEPGFAAWELDTPRTGERIEVPLPRSQAALLTLQSRRVLLERSEDSVVGFKLIGGDFFLKDNAFSEQMTIWRATDKDNVYSPKRHNSSRQLWRDFSALFVKGEKARVPGIVKWLEKLDHAGFISSGHIKMRAASVQYGDKDFFVNDIFDDSISINAGLLSALSEPWIIRINDSLSTTERMVSALGNLAADMAEAAGESFSNNEASKRRRMAHRDKSNENAYFNLDMPFRDWLAGIDPKTDDIDDKIVEWLDNAERIIRGLGRDMAADTGMVAFVGKKTQDGMTSSKAFNKFKNTLYKIRNGERMQ